MQEYLLGGLPPEERERMEERLFHDDALSEDLQATADELIRIYLVGGLSAADRHRFESHFLASPRQRRRLLFMKGLLAAIQRVAPARTRRAPAWPVWLAAAAAVLVAAAGLWLARRGGPTPVPTEVAQVTPPPAPSTLQPQGERSPEPRDVPRRTPEPRRVQVVRVRPAPQAETRVALAANTGTVRLEVPVDPDPPSFNAVIHAADGAEVWRAERQAPVRTGDPLVLAVPAEVLVADAYTLSVEAEHLRSDTPPAVKTFTLRVVRKE